MLSLGRLHLPFSPCLLFVWYVFFFFFYILNRLLLLLFCVFGLSTLRYCCKKMMMCAFLLPHYSIFHTHRNQHMNDEHVCSSRFKLSFLTFIHLIDVIYCPMKLPRLTISHSRSLFINSFRPFSLSPLFFGSVHLYDSLARCLYVYVFVSGYLHMSIFKLLYSRIFKVV